MIHKTQCERLIAMMHQIADNNTHHGSSERNAEVVAEHTIKFWARPMKQDILAYYHEEQETLSEDSRMVLQGVESQFSKKSVMS